MDSTDTRSWSDVAYAYVTAPVTAVSGVIDAASGAYDRTLDASVEIAREVQDTARELGDNLEGGAASAARLGTAGAAVIATTQAAAATIAVTVALGYAAFKAGLLKRFL